MSDEHETDANTDSYVSIRALVLVMRERDEARRDVQRLTAERDEARRRNLLLLSKLQEYEAREQ